MGGAIGSSLLGCCRRSIQSARPGRGEGGATNSRGLPLACGVLQGLSYRQQGGPVGMQCVAGIKWYATKDLGSLQQKKSGHCRLAGGGVWMAGRPRRDTQTVWQVYREHGVWQEEGAEDLPAAGWGAAGGNAKAGTAVGRCGDRLRVCVHGCQSTQLAAGSDAGPLPAGRLLPWTPRCCK